MPLTTRHERLEASQSGKLRRYVWYAVGEILLIFAGITLALWFSNWNEDRQLRRLETSTLAEIVADLKANIDYISSTVDADNQDIAACERFLSSVSRREPWKDTFAKDLGLCRWWTSPFLSSAAYESLKIKGTDLITDSPSRNAIVKLYEQTYAYLIEDTDKGLWALETSVFLPVFNKHTRVVAPDSLVPNDYETLFERNEFISMLYLKMDGQKTSVKQQQFAIAETETVIELIEKRLVQ